MRAWIRRWLDHLEALERDRAGYLNASPEIRDAYLAGYAAGLTDAPAVIRW